MIWQMDSLGINLAMNAAGILHSQNLSVTHANV